MSEILIFRNFLDEDTCRLMNDWVDQGVENKWLDSGISRGSGWEYQKRLTTRNYGDRFDYAAIVYEVFEKITNHLNLQHLPKSVVGGGKNGIVVSYTKPEGDVYNHRDPMEENGSHVLRCNIMTRKADAGAELYINNEKIDVGVGDLHCYLPSDLWHYVTEAQGDTARIMWMFGYQISKQEWLQILEREHVCQ